MDEIEVGYEMKESKGRKWFQESRSKDTISLGVKISLELNISLGVKISFGRRGKCSKTNSRSG